MTYTFFVCFLQHCVDCWLTLGVQLQPAVSADGKVRCSSGVRNRNIGAQAQEQGLFVANLELEQGKCILIFNSPAL